MLEFLFFLANPNLVHFIHNQRVQSSWYNIENRELCCDREALVMMWSTLFTCLLISL